MKVDYIIVGLGLAGLAFAEQLLKKSKSFLLFEDGSQQASRVAAGVYNPLVLKRFTKVWDAADQLAIALPFYRELEERFQIKLDHKLDILRVFKSVEEQNNWFHISDQPFFADYMIPRVFKNANPQVIAPFDYGRMTNTGKMDIALLLNAYRSYLEDQGTLIPEHFDHNAIQFSEHSVLYHNIQASKVVFCEGYGLKDNPFFRNTGLQEAKGELLTIHAPGLRVTDILKSLVFVLPLGNDYYRVGATFNWADKTNEPSEEGREELVEKLRKVIRVDFEVTEQSAGIRPAVKDRRPLLGRHPVYRQLAILNGLGTRGVMLAPKMAKLLYEHLEFDTALPPEVRFDRFHKAE
ncbi:MAG: FAD-binding oxidoreductase [Flavobacteriaceae bacterium]|nr:FAD-binding oxidoreductase [Flavobacteriaceae bacterium]